MISGDLEIGSYVSQKRGNREVQTVPKLLQKEGNVTWTRATWSL